ncbi:Predicted arabinose efflux permease, MFS family [Halopenitus malekzadehii]|uniref:Predicted arabinose efflux permease, MFS family n=2 Tax=Halopenitus malekzadehii TaxID=1267564 RepID=A0A1H6JRJ3_9EURY|nr:MFS transporter [Halopenitus malekzadehii]SEH64788.1 Predicted arabinose efflux permease, MFS family [Halopenitus malekzadehii]
MTEPSTDGPPGGATEAIDPSDGQVTDGQAPDGPAPDGRRSWIVAIAGAIGMVFTFGTAFSYGVFRAPVSATFGVDPVALSTVFSAMLFTFFIGSGIVGIFAARLPARGVLLACSVVTGLLAPSLYVVDSLAGLLVVFATMGLAGGTTFVLVASIVPRWFRRHRGAATGLVFVGNGVGLTVLPPAWEYAFSTVGVREGFLWLMGVTAVAFACTGAVCRRPEWAETSGSSLGELVVWLRGLVGTRTFQLLVVGIGLSFAWYQLFAAYAIDLFTARGLAGGTASAAFGLVGGVSIASRIGGGYVADRIGSRLAFIGSLSCVIVGLGALLVPSSSTLALGIFLVGLGSGGGATLYVPLLMEVYSPERDTAIIGVFNLSPGVSAIAMPPLGAATIAYTDGYTTAIVVTIAITVLGVGLTAFATTPD